MMVTEVSCKPCYYRQRVEPKMLLRVSKIILCLAVLISVPVVLVGYKVYNSGEDYGQIAQVAAAETLRHTTTGSVLGFVDDTNTHTWMGIPYAAAPVGDLRWRPPQPAVSWQGRLKALKAGDFCMQLGSQMESRPAKEWGKVIGSEDCLKLNVFAPKFAPDAIPKGDQALPVMLYIHGGGNLVGYANQYKYSGKFLAQQHRVIVVNFNYRLGPFGWFAHPGLNQGASDEGNSGNFGNLDSLAALKWVQANIGNFGGNPNNVTLFGESAGGMNTYALLASPLAKGLFHKAIVQSGASVSAPMHMAQNYSDDNNPGVANSGREVVNRLLIRDGLANDRQQAKSLQNSMSNRALSDYLRAKTAAELLSIYKTDGGDLADIPQIFRDGVVVPLTPITQLFADSSSYNAVPIILGSNRDEVKMMALADSELVEFEYGVLPRVKNPQLHQSVTAYYNDAIKAIGVDIVAATLARGQANNVYAYRFDWDEFSPLLGVDIAKLIGAAHASELAFVFNAFDDTFINGLLFDADNTPGRDVLAASMSSYWAEFAYNGAPGKGRDGNLTPWQPWNNNPDSRDKFVILDDENDGGIRMSNDAVNFNVLRQRLISDSSFSGNQRHSQMYDCLLSSTELWQQKEFESLGGVSCDMPIFARMGRTLK